MSPSSLESSQQISVDDPEYGQDTDASAAGGVNLVELGHVAREAEPATPVSGSVRSHAIWAVIGRFASLATAIGTTLCLARMLEPADFGRYSIAKSAIIGFGTLAAFGLGTTALKLLSDVRSRRDAIARIWSIRLVAIGSSIAASALAACFFGFLFESMFGRSLSWPLVGVLILGIVATGVGELHCQVTRALGDPASANFFGGLRGGSILNSIVLAATIFLFVIGQLSWETAAFAYVGAVGVSAAGTLATARRQVRRLSGTTSLDTSDESVGDWPRVGSVASTAWPLAGVSILGFLALQADVVFAGLLANDSDLAGYVAARRVTMLLATPMTILTSWLTGIVGPKWASEDYGELTRLLQLGAGTVAIPYCIGCVVILCVPEFVLWLALGSGYESGASLLRILMGGQMALVFTGGCGVLLSLSGNQRIQLMISVLSTAILLVGAAVSIHHQSAVGLAWSASASLVVLNVLMWVAAWRLTGINTAVSRRGLRDAIGLVRRHLPAIGQ